MASEADFGGRSVGPQQLIIGFLGTCFAAYGGGVNDSHCSFGGYYSHGNGICLFLPMQLRRRA
eukprot:10723364-Ditylum_brightwellii.AAC.1